MTWILSNILKRLHSKLSPCKFKRKKMRVRTVKRKRKSTQRTCFLAWSWVSRKIINLRRWIIWMHQEMKVITGRAVLIQRVFWEKLKKKYYTIKMTMVKIPRMFCHYQLLFQTLLSLMKNSSNSLLKWNNLNCIELSATFTNRNQDSSLSKLDNLSLFSMKLMDGYAVLLRHPLVNSVLCLKMAICNLKE